MEGHCLELPLNTLNLSRLKRSGSLIDLQCVYWKQGYRDSERHDNLLISDTVVT